MIRTIITLTLTIPVSIQVCKKKKQYRSIYIRLLQYFPEQQVGKQSMQHSRQIIQSTDRLKTTHEPCMSEHFFVKQKLLWLSSPHCRVQIDPPFILHIAFTANRDTHIVLKTVHANLTN